MTHGGLSLPRLRKAFDSVNHRFLLVKLKASGIDETVLNWIKSSCQIVHTRSNSTASFLRRLPVIVASPKVQLLAQCFFCYTQMIFPPLLLILLSFLQMTLKWCTHHPNQVAFYPRFLPPGPGQRNGTYQSIPTNVHASPSGTPLHFLRRSPRQTPTTESPKSPTSETKGFPQHDLHRVSPLHRGCEYSKVFAVHGPKILLCTVKDSVHPTLLRLSVASSRVCNGGQRPNTEGGYKPT